MKKGLLLIYSVGCLLTACVSNNITWSANDNMKKVMVGMDKEQVIRILGKDYMIDSSSKDSQGHSVEVLAYKSDIDEEYKLKFVNSRLVEWNREHIRKHVIEKPSS